MKRYKGEIFNIPFYEAKSELYRVKLRIKKNKLDDPDNTEPGDFTSADMQYIKKRAVRRFVTYFFPEFYAYLYDETAFALMTNADITVAEELIEDLTKRTNVEGVGSMGAYPAKWLMICTVLYPVQKKRQQLIAAEKMPSYEETLTFFNTQQGNTGMSSASTFDVAHLGKTNKSLNDGLKTYNQQMQGFEGQLNINVDFNILQLSTNAVLNKAITMLSRQLNVGKPSYAFSEADTITISFGTQSREGAPDRLAIVRMDYLLVEDSLGSRPMTIGYISQMKYNNKLRDPLTLAVLKNYELMLEAVNTSGPLGMGSNSGFSFMEFLTHPEVTGSLGQMGSIFDTPPPNLFKEAENLFMEAAKEFELIDITNTEALEKGFKTAFNSAELRSLKIRVADNPEVFAAVQAANVEKALDAAVDISKKLDNILQNGPFAFVEKNPVIDRLFRELGIEELAKEAVMCLMMGLNISISRVTQAVQKSLSEIKSSLYYPPTLPRTSISKPKIDPDQFQLFSIGPEIWKEILQIVVDTLQQAAIEIIKKLAEILKFECPFTNPRAQDEGAQDIVAMINPINPGLLGGPGSPLDQIANTRAITPEELSIYLRALSGILTSTEICILFQASERSNMSGPLMDKMIEFNEEYPHPYIRHELVSWSSMTAFIAQVSQYVDVTELCNEIANEVYVLNKERIDICLAPRDPLTGDMIELVDIFENGLQLQMPEINLDCPDRDNFLNDPTITVAIPEVFSTLTHTVATQFNESVGSVKNILLEPRMVTGTGGSNIFSNLVDAEVDTSSLGELDPRFLENIVKVLDTIASLDLEQCEIDLSTIAGFDVASAAEFAANITNVIAGVLSDPEFLDSIEGVRDQLESMKPEDIVAGGPGGGGLTPFASYRFNVNYLREFINYINIGETTYANGRVAIPLHFGSSVGDPPPEEGEFQAMEADLTQFQPIHLNFSFPFLAPYSFGVRPPSMVSGAEVSGVGQVDPITGIPVGPASCTRTEQFIASLIYRVLMISVGQGSSYGFGEYADNPNITIPNFETISPQAFKELRFASQATHTIPLKKLTPVLLDAIKAYFAIYGPELLNAGIYVMIKRDYEEENNCALTFLGPDALEIQYVQYVNEAIESFSPSELETSRSYLELIYPRELPETPNLIMNFHSSGDLIPEESFSTYISSSATEQAFETPTLNEQNVYLKPFVDKFKYALFEADPSRNPSPRPTGSGDKASLGLSASQKREVESKHFPIVYALLVDGMFDYVVRNGIFDAGTLQSLSLFPNPDCPPHQSGDLLDIKGIFQQMREEYVEAACSRNREGMPLRVIVRDIIKYGLYLLLFQTHVAEVVVKNIFVLSAFKVGEIMRDKEGFVFKYIKSQIRLSITRFLDTLEASGTITMREDLVAYFNRKISRDLVSNQGGITYGDNRIAFPNNTLFANHSYPATPPVSEEENAAANARQASATGTATFEDIIDYMLEDRLIIGGTAINNILRFALPDNDPVSLNEAFLASIPTYTVPEDGRNFVTSRAKSIFGEEEGVYEVFFTRRRQTEGVLSRPRARIKLWYYYGGEDPRAVKIFQLAGSITSGDEPKGLIDALRDGDIVASVSSGPGPGGFDDPPAEGPGAPAGVPGVGV